MAAPQFSDFVLETANNPGTGQFVLDGAVAGRRSFSAAFPAGGTVFYYADDGVLAEWGYGTLDVSGPVTLTRQIVAGNTAETKSPVNFTGAVRVYSDVPATYLPVMGPDGVPYGGGKPLALQEWVRANYIAQTGGMVKSDLFVSPADSGATSAPGIGAALIDGNGNPTAKATLTVTNINGTPSGRLQFSGGGRSIDIEILSIATRGWAQERLPIGTMLMWWGKAASVPTGWAICNGDNGTPDLRGLAIIGAASDDEAGSKIGAEKWSGGTTGGHALTVDEIPEHSHTINHTTYYLKGDGSGPAWTTGNGQTITTNAVGGGKEHSHSLPEIDLYQPSMRLWVIMRISYPDTDTTTGGGSNGGTGSQAVIGSYSCQSFGGGDTFTLDVSSYGVFNITLSQPTAAITLGAFNAEQGMARQLQIVLKQGTGANSVTWPDNVKWTGNRAPTLSLDIGAIDVVQLMTLDNGQTWLGTQLDGWIT